jgi:hypothetical protein
MAMTQQQQAQFDEVKAAVAEIKDVVHNSLSIQNVGGYHIFNLAIALEEKMAKLEAELNA